MAIAIRDIFVEIRCKKSADFVITREKTEKPKPTSNSFSIDLGPSLDGLIGKSTLLVNENADEVVIQISHQALQPQRSITLQHPLFIGGQKKQNVDFEVSIYADCFPKPLNKKVAIIVDPTKIKRTPKELLEELEILKSE
jgi:hypothetical protein